ncbi:MAG: bifunctional methylenetetrahydrofolate dehydrogenase/methenyltetrahydrofolate cyclohydrolase FolD [Proteobacteria bacterium]|nr:bifunctional methylenetetrahydrofolate dehydrogenase/methenyltetrahydrofolate cyclohydrolase FolD [Pseudomonadota bacterium]MCP4921947.1 bifunctional methylenetetrahydrofolate dehydrogenase/methenyltetrahydrofolate cyclohydrolase FolD [Pseudomonadota bacterium]
MMANLLNGRVLAKKLNQGTVKVEAAKLARKPGLAVVLVGEDAASKVYVGRKTLVASRVGFEHQQITLPVETSQAELLSVIAGLNADDAVDGILVQLPLPKHIDGTFVLDTIAPEKDVDGFHPVNAGLLAQGRPRFVACTPKGVMELLRDADLSLSGKSAVVVGRSNIVGRPMAQLLEQANCTVTVCHSRTTDLEARVRAADVLVVAIGRPKAIVGDWVKPGAIVVDVGINRLDDGSLCGDVDFEGAVDKAGWITPVPGGVGPMTIAMLMANTLASAQARQA